MPRKREGAVYMTVDLTAEVYASVRRAAAIRGVSTLKFVRSVLETICTEQRAHNRDCVTPDTVVRKTLQTSDTTADKLLSEIDSFWGTD